MPVIHVAQVDPKSVYTEGHTLCKASNGGGKEFLSYIMTDSPHTRLTGQSMFGHPLTLGCVS